MASIQSIVYKPKGLPDAEDAYTRVPLHRARLIVGRGIEGDAKGVPRRQLNIMSAATLAALAADGYNVEPGALGEQIVIDGLQVEALASGTVLQVGEAARIEIVKPREGCSRFQHIQGQTDFDGRLGVIARVVAEGEIAVGSPVMVLHTDPTQASS